MTSCHLCSQAIGHQRAGSLGIVTGPIRSGSSRHQWTATVLNSVPFPFAAEQPFVAEEELNRPKQSQGARSQPDVGQQRKQGKDVMSPFSKKPRSPFPSPSLCQDETHPKPALPVGISLALTLDL